MTEKKKKQDVKVHYPCCRENFVLVECYGFYLFYGLQECVYNGSETVAFFCHSCADFQIYKFFQGHDSG